MGDISNGTRAIAVAAVSALLAVFCSTASAGTATVGESFPISYLTVPPNAEPGSNSGIMGMGYASSPTSVDGRYVLFASESDNLSTGYNLDAINVFRKDTQTGNVVLVNRGTNGDAIGGYFEMKMSGDGNLVALVTDQPMDPADVDGKADIYLRNIQAGTTTLLTPSVTDDVYFADLSADGNYVAFLTNQALSPGDLNTDTDAYRLKISDGSIKLVSATNGTTTAGNGDTGQPSISGDGTWVAFGSSSTNLIAGFTDDNGVYGLDIFVRNVDTNATHLVSARHNAASTGGNGSAEEAAIAGTPASLAEVKVAFTSYATNLADNGVTDNSDSASVYLRSMPSTPSELISRATGPAGVNADSRAHTPSVSDDGARIIFATDAANLGPEPDYYGAYLRDLGDSTTHLISARNDYAVQGEISGNGNAGTWAEAGGATADSDQDLASVFIRSLPTGQIRLVSRPKGNKTVRAPGAQIYDLSERALSATGRYFVFTSSSQRLPGAIPGEFREQAYRRDLKTGEIELVSRASGPNGAASEYGDDPTVSADGNLVAFRARGSLVPADTNDKSDVYVRNMTTGVTTLVSRAAGAGGVVGDEGSDEPSISGNGKRVAFASESSNLGTDGANDYLYVRDLESNQTIVVSRATTEAGVIANGDSGGPSLSFDGSKVIFTSYAHNLDPADASPNQSIYLRDLSTNTTTLLSRAPGLAGASISDFTYGPAISGNGARVAWVTYKESAVPDTAPWPAGATQVVVRDVADGNNHLGSISTGGQPGDQSSGYPSLNRDGTVLAFSTDATNLRDGFDNTDRQTVVVRDLTTGQVSGPPRFGLTASSARGSAQPSVSDSGDCVAYAAQGHNDISGGLGDFDSAYVFVNRGTCLDPLTLKPKLSQVKLKPKKFRVSPKRTAKSSARKRTPRGTKIKFRLNTRATVTIWIDRKVKRKGKTKFVRRGKLVRKNLAPGNRTVAFSGRIGRKALRPGNYRIVLQARAGVDKSNKPARPFKVVKR